MTSERHVEQAMEVLKAHLDRPDICRLTDVASKRRTRRRQIRATVFTIAIATLSIVGLEQISHSEPVETAGPPTTSVETFKVDESHTGSPPSTEAPVATFPTATTIDVRLRYPTNDFKIGDAQHLAIVDGTLRIDLDCIYLDAYGFVTLVVLPGYYSRVDDDGQIWVHDKALVDGETYTFGGSRREYSKSSHNPGLLRSIPETCEAEYIFYLGQ